MIPKIIHYCWFGGKPLPEREAAFVEDWKRALPGYEIMRWDEQTFTPPAELKRFVAEALAMGDYAFAADVARLWALHTFGGIYLDTDIEVVGSFDPYLSLDSFLGYESGGLVGTGVMGASKGCRWIGKFLDYYRGRHYINMWGHPQRTPNTKILTRRILPALADDEKPRIFPAELFCAKDYSTGELTVTPSTVAIHHYAASWRRRRTLLSRIKTIFRGLSVRYLKQC